MVTNLEKCGTNSSTLAQFFNLTWEPPSVTDSTIHRYELEVEKTEYIGQTETFKVFSVSSEYVHQNENLTIRLTAVNVCSKRRHTTYSEPLSTTDTTSLDAKQLQSTKRTELIVIATTLPIGLLVIIIVLLIVLISVIVCYKSKSPMADESMVIQLKEKEINVYTHHLHV